MRASRLAAVCLAVLALAPAAGARVELRAAPTDLHAFLLRADEPRTASFARTPAFAWNPVPGAVRYQFQLATSATFRENSIVYSAKSLKTPVAAPAVTLPWISDMFHARVRAILANSATPWSRLYNFDMDAPPAPTALASYPGLLRWEAIEGADGYEIWFLDVNNPNPKKEVVYTNVLDEREFYTFHRDTKWTGSVRWRIRALRADNERSKRQNGVPVVTYGPWSSPYISSNPQYKGGPIQLIGTVSDVVSTSASSETHKLMPGFVFSGDQAIDGTSAELFRVYVFTDRSCLNRVYTSALVGGPAYAPRPYGPLQIPSSPAAARSTYLPDGAEAQSYTYDFEPVQSTESLPQATPTTAVPDDSDTDPGELATAPPAAPQQITVSGNLGAPVDLWDTQSIGGYWWTVVPVGIVVPGALSTNLSAPGALVGATTISVVNSAGLSTGDVLVVGNATNQDNVTVVSVSGSIVTLAAPLKFAHGSGEPVVRSGGTPFYRDLELPQEVCAAPYNRVARFTKNSEPSLTAAGELFATGLSRKGKLRTDSPFYGYPMVAWTPALGASAYEVQWSKTRAPFNPRPNPENENAPGTMTLGTAAVLPLAPGTWYYRVRGFNYSLPTNAQQMAWSDPAKIVVLKPQFTVVPPK